VRSRSWLADSARSPANSEGGSLRGQALDVGGDGGNPPALTRSPAPASSTNAKRPPGQAGQALAVGGDGGKPAALTRSPAPASSTNAKRPPGQAGQALDVGGDGGNAPTLTRSPAPQYPNLLVPDPGKPDRALTTAEMEGTVRRQGAFLPNPASSTNAKRPPGQAGQALDVGGDGGNRQAPRRLPPKSPSVRICCGHHPEGRQPQQPRRWREPSGAKAPSSQIPQCPNLLWPPP
jgi:hypothetical protein